MYKKLAALLTALLLMAGLCAAEGAAPVLVDRINAPQDHADFAFAADAPLFEVIFPQILNADAALLRCGGETMLVDCGTHAMGQRVIDMCRQLGITRIDRFVNTHPHADHIGGLQRICQEVEIGEMWICFPEDVNSHMVKAVDFARRQGMPIRTFGDGDVLTLGGAAIDVWKLEGNIAQMNDCSAQFFVTFGERTLLMAADLEHDGQEQLVQLKGSALDADVLKYPHHGKDPLRTDYMEAVSPLFMVVTNNLAEHPGRKYVRASGVPNAYTVPGFVCLTTDGQTWVADRIVSKLKYK